jgi:hypothetical protein
MRRTSKSSCFMLTGLEPRIVFALTGYHLALYNSLNPSFASAIGTSPALDNVPFQNTLLTFMKSAPGQNGRPTGVESGMDGNGDQNFYYSLDSASPAANKPSRISDRVTAINSSANGPSLAGARNGAENLLSTPAYDLVTPDSTDDRHAHWVPIAQAHRYESTGVLTTPNGKSNTRFVDRIVSQVNDWHAFFVVEPGDTDPLKPYGAEYNNPGQIDGPLLGLAERISAWSLVYPLVVESDQWTPEINAKFMYHYILQANALLEHAKGGPSGDGFVYDDSNRVALDAIGASPPVAGFTPVDHNKIIEHAEALLAAGNLFPEAANAGQWRGSSRSILYGPVNGSTRDTQYSEISRAFYDDGGSLEMSENYAEKQLNSLVRIALIDQINGQAVGTANWQYWDNTAPDAPTYAHFLDRIARNRYDTLTPSSEGHSFGDHDVDPTELGKFRVATIVFADKVLDKIDASTSAFNRTSITTEGVEVIGLDDMWVFGSGGSQGANAKTLSGRGFSNQTTVKDSGFFAIRSGDLTASSAKDARQLLFRGGNPDGSSYPVVGSMGEASHTHRDLLSININAWQRRLFADNKSEDKSGRHNMMVPYVGTNPPQNANHRKQSYFYDDSTTPQLQAGTLVVTGGRNDYAGPASGSAPGRQYRQSTSWHNAWKSSEFTSIGEQQITGNVNTDPMARSVWMAVAAPSSTGLGWNPWPSSDSKVARYGTSMLIDFAEADASQSYAVSLYPNQAPNSSRGGLGPLIVANDASTTATTRRVFGSSSGVQMRVTPVTTGAPRAINTSWDSANLVLRTSLASSVSAGNRVLMAHAISSGVGTTLPDPTTRWVSHDSLGNGVVELYFRDADANTRATQEAWKVRFAPPGQAVPARSATTAIAATDFDAYRGADHVDGSGNSLGHVRSLQNGDFIRFNDVDFGSTGANSFVANVGVANAEAGGSFEIWVEDGGSTPVRNVGTLTFGTGTGTDWTVAQDRTVQLSETLTGQKDVILKAIHSGNNSTGQPKSVARLNSIRFAGGSGGQFVQITSGAITSYSNQDGTGSSASVIESGNGISLSGNAWKKIPLARTLTSSSVLTFQFRSSDESEINGIGLDNDNIHDNRSPQTFKLFGTQSGSPDISTTYDTYTGTSWISFSIPVGQIYGAGSVSNLVFVNDNDAGTGTSEFRNIQIT